VHFLVEKSERETQFGAEQTNATPLPSGLVQVLSSQQSLVSHTPPGHGTSVTEPCILDRVPSKHAFVANHPLHDCSQQSWSRQAPSGQSCAVTLDF